MSSPYKLLFSNNNKCYYTKHPIDKIYISFIYKNPLKTQYKKKTVLRVKYPIVFFLTDTQNIVEMRRK